jgi:hypothetical protein
MNGLPEQSPELLALADALAGIAPPCFKDPDAWFEDRQTAAHLCLDCHALDECRTYAASVKPSHGVWAGRDHETKQRKRSA